MYVILKNNRRSSKQLFETYEKARQYLRKMFRKKLGAEAYYAEAEKNGGWPLWDNISRNPTSHTVLGYNIRKISNA